MKQYLRKLIPAVAAALGAACLMFALGCEGAQPVQPLPTGLQMQASPSRAPETPKPSPSPSPSPSPVPTPFSLVWLSDTQNMSYYDFPGALESMGRWIADEKQEQNILYVVQTGDAVDEGWVPKQWAHFDQMYDQFKDVLPYFPIAGNHDVGIKWHGYEPYLARPYMQDFPPEQSFDGGKALYTTFSAGGTDFLLLGAGWESEENAAGWMNDVLKQHENDVAILLFHGYIRTDGTFTKVGKLMYEQVVAPNPNVRLVLCGHISGTGFRTDEFDDTGDGVPDRVVNAMLYNYQHYGENCGQLRILTFDPLARSIEVTTYSPFRNRYYKDDTFKAETFDLDHAF